MGLRTIAIAAAEACRSRAAAPQSGRCRLCPSQPPRRRATPSLPPLGHHTHTVWTPGTRAAAVVSPGPPRRPTMLSRGLLLLLLMTSTTVVRAQLDGHAIPGCHDATIAWLRVQARSHDPEIRRSARHLLRAYGYDVLDARPLPAQLREEDAPPPTSVRRREAAPLLLAPPSFRHRGDARLPPPTSVRRREDTLLPPRISIRRRESTLLPPRITRRVQGDGGANDGPALRATFRPVVGTQEQWLHALGWPTGASANPCDGNHWSGCSCDNDRVTSVDLSGKTLPSYTLQPAVERLTQLQYLDLHSTGVTQFAI
eukprot:COSAG01_NODE_13027_length_1646_cov_28.511959_2_plen_313_part_00